MDRWIDSGVAVDVPEPVVLEAGVRRVWAGHRAPQVLLSGGRGRDADNEERKEGRGCRCPLTLRYGFFAIDVWLLFECIASILRVMLLLTASRKCIIARAQRIRWTLGDYSRAWTLGYVHCLAYSRCVGWCSLDRLASDAYGGTGDRKIRHDSMRPLPCRSSAASMITFHITDTKQKTRKGITLAIGGIVTCILHRRGTPACGPLTLYTRARSSRARVSRSSRSVSTIA